MSANLIEKARKNRNDALSYVSEQKTKLVSVADFRKPLSKRAPIPAFGFSSIRAAVQTGAAA